MTVQEIIYNVLYDRFYKWSQTETNLVELSEETRLHKSTINAYLFRLSKMGLIKVDRNWKRIRINDVQRVYFPKLDK